MKTLDEVVEATKELPEELQAEVRDFARFLRENRASAPRRNVRKQQSEDEFGDQLAIMARDRDVKAELQTIDREFMSTESDGLTKN